MSGGSRANGAVEVSVEGAELTIHWPDLGVTLGPCRASAVVDGVERDATVVVDVPDEGPVVVVRAEVAVDAPAVVDRVTLLAGPLDLPWRRRLVDGYDSWAYSGVRDDAAGASFWNGALVDGDGRALVVQALDARRGCTRVAVDGAVVRVDCGAPPGLTKVAGTWGYVVDAPPGLGLPLAAGESFAAEPVAVGAGPDATALVEDLAARAARSMGARRWDGPQAFGWESWYHFGLFVSADDVRANARVLRERYPSRPDLDLVQVDDGWQRTYGAWWPNERFPDDLGELVRELESLGCRAGLWIAPFRVQPDAPGVATDHPDWMIGDGAGAPLREDRHGTWALDASHPEAVDWVRDLGRQVRAWGFRMVKVDFCYLGALAGQRHDVRVTGIEALQRGLRALVDGLGDDVYVLGCGMPMLPAVGVCHGNRVGHDLAMPRVHQELGHPVDDGWTGFAGVRAQARNVAARWAQAGRWFDADPEVVMAWGGDGADPAGYATEEARTIATMVALCGGPFLLADDLPALAPAERAVLEHPGLIELVRPGGFRPDDLFAIADPAEVVEQVFSQGPGIAATWRAEREGREVVALFNWTDRDVRRAVPPALVGAVELWTGEAARAELDVPAHGVRVLLGSGPPA